MADASHGADPYVLIIRFGYFGTPAKTLAHLAATLGSVLDGEVLAYGRADYAKLGRFEIRSWGTSPQHPMRERIPFFLGVLWRAFRARWIARRRLVIVTYDPFQSGLLGLAARMLTGAPVVVEVNGDFSNPVALSAPGRGPRELSQRLRVGRFVLRRAQLIKLLYRDQLSGLGVSVPPERIVVYFNLVDTTTFALPARAREPFFLFAGHPLQIKGGDILLRAFAQIAEQLPEWRLLMVGHRVEEHARKCGAPIGTQVEFLPPQSPAVLAELMSRCGVFVLPSRTEGMGRVLVEAATAGAPRVASRVGGIPAVVEDGVDGLLVNPEDDAALAEQMRSLAQDEARRVRLSMSASLRAKEELSPECYTAHFRSAVERAGQ